MDIVNIVGKANLQSELDLGELSKYLDSAKEFTNIDYSPEKYHWLGCTLETTNTYVAFYRSGICSIVGTKSISEFNTVSGNLRSLMDAVLDWEFDFDPRITNIVATSSLETEVDLNSASVVLGFESTEYEPEQFSGLIYRGGDGVILLFSSGKMVSTGLICPNEIQNSLIQFEDLLKDI